LRIAAGEALPFSQADLTQRGHAIECRLYAEDPANQFLPASGPLLRFIPPEGPGVRVDSGILEGMTVGTHYDPLLAKIITVAEDRPNAIQRMRAALAELVVLGVVTNREFLGDVLSHPTFAAGQATTAFIEHEFSQPAAGGDIPPAVWIAAALADLHGQPVLNNHSGHPGEDAHSPWTRLAGFRMGEGRG
jgi:acetyl/propionyl-CoA carboxylase alpha subunit